MKSLNMKKVLVALIVALVVVSISSICFAVIINPGDITAQSSQAGNQIQNASGIVLGVLQVIGVAVAVIVLVILAIKYISAAPADKADIKKSAFAYIIGALLLFGGVAVLNIIQNAGSELESTTSGYGLVEYK